MNKTYLINRHEIKEIVRFDYVHGDIKWEPRNAVIYPTFFIGAGLCAGMFGIGGGMITVPLMLAMGVHPAVVSATASSVVFFTAALSTSSFAVFDLILWDYASVCVCIGFFASLVGQSIMKRARQSATADNFERNSFIAYCIGGVIMLSALLMTMQYVLDIVSYDENTKSSCVRRARILNFPHRDVAYSTIYADRLFGGGARYATKQKWRLLLPGASGPRLRR